ncbi:MAG: hypothetical protein OXH93_08345 [Caldilineaceae bacterium]|nr:hypothetical protein [Caldilineaceae bacterium]
MSKTARTPPGHHMNLSPPSRCPIPAPSRKIDNTRTAGEPQF